MNQLKLFCVILMICLFQMTPVSTVYGQKGSKFDNKNFSVPVYAAQQAASCNIDYGFKICTAGTDDDGDGFVCPPNEPPALVPRIKNADCPCIGGLKVEMDGCTAHLSCTLDEDKRYTANVELPCPHVADPNPEYPLVKMLSGTLVEWLLPEIELDVPKFLGRGAPAGMAGEGAFPGAEVINSPKVTFMISSVDTGNKWNPEKAKSITSRQNILDRHNFEFFFKGNNKKIAVLDQQEIYEAYKNKSDYVQAYLALAGKGFGERPWETYEKFIEAMCERSFDKKQCVKSLSAKKHKDPEERANYYLGSANTSIMGVYSEYSSHPCHGATTVSDSGQPAFAFTFESTWYVYVDVEFPSSAAWTCTQEYIGECCVQWTAGWSCDGAPYPCPDNPGALCQNCKPVAECTQWRSLFNITWSWIGSGGGKSRGNCKAEITQKGYMNDKGEMVTEPLGLSFFQSQALLVTP